MPQRIETLPCEFCNTTLKSCFYATYNARRLKETIYLNKIGHHRMQLAIILQGLNYPTTAMNLEREQIKSRDKVDSTRAFGRIQPARGIAAK